MSKNLVVCTVAFLSLTACSDRLNSDLLHPGDAGTTYGGDGKLAVHFDAHHSDDGDDSADADESPVVDTECGQAVGIRLAIAGPDGVEQACEENWEDVTVSGAFAGDEDVEGDHLVADCFFVVEPGTWSINELAAIDSSSDALECCDSDIAPTVDVLESATTELSGVISCDTAQNGGLDIYATVNTQPVITELEISPSKFGETCKAISLRVEAEDAEGDGLSYKWEVVSAPAAADYLLENADEEEAAFSTNTMGDYELKVTATDELGLSSYLTFPLHIVEDNYDGECDLSSC